MIDKKNTHNDFVGLHCLRHGNKTIIKIREKEEKIGKTKSVGNTVFVIITSKAQK